MSDLCVLMLLICSSCAVRYLIFDDVFSLVLVMSFLVYCFYQSFSITYHCCLLGGWSGRL